MICEHQQTSVLCDKCAILALVKQNAALKEHIATAQTLLDSAHNFQYLKACEQARDKAEKENAALRKRIADATSPAGVERATMAMLTYEGGTSREYMRAAIKAAPNWREGNEMTTPIVTDEIVKAFMDAPFVVNMRNEDNIRFCLQRAIAAMPPIKLVKAEYKVPGESQTYSSYWEGVCDGIESAKASIEEAGMRWAE